VRLPGPLRRIVPPPEPPLAETVTVVATQGRWQPEPGCRYLTARELPMPRHPDVLVFGDWHPPPSRDA
jgi:hypothetical protein